MLERLGEIVVQGQQEVRLLDGFELRVAGEPVALPRSSQRLLAILALRTRPMLRHCLAGALWPEVPEDRALGNLRSALWRLQRPLGGVARATDGSVRLAAPVRVDLREASDLARRVIAGSGDPDDIARAPSVLRGELLPDWYDDWVVLEREHFRQLSVHALEALAEDLTAAGQLGAALEAALAAVADEPLRESAHRAVIRVHMAEGNAIEAVKQFSTCRRLLRERLDVGPSPLLRGLVGELPQTALPDHLRW
jgi:DNA-binding SARP family transcriptional activator